MVGTIFQHISIPIRVLTVKLQIKKTPMDVDIVGWSWCSEPGIQAAKRSPMPIGYDQDFTTW